MKKREQQILAVFSVISFVLLVGSCFWAVSKKAIWTSVAKLWPDPWFRVTLLDLYIGFLIFLIYVMYREKSVFKTLFWAALMAGLGNIAALLYILIQLSFSKKPLKESKRESWSLL